jgi:penicillin G amidase
VLPQQRRASQARRVVNIVLALAVSAVLLVVLGAGYGVIPALGPALDPGHGAWTAASAAALPRTQTLRLAGLSRPVQVSFSPAGIPSITAATDDDLYLALGYLQARFRLTQMDLERRVGEGRLAQLAGPDAVASDKFELRLGLLRTAQQEWAQMPKTSPAAQALVAFSRGVNDDLASLRASHQWPSLFSLAGVYPASWTPVDSLLIQGDFTQALSFTTTPLDYELLERSLGARQTMDWFPVLPVGQQHPFDPGPYRYRGIAPISSGGALGAVGRTTARAGRQSPAPGPVRKSNSAQAAAAILASVQSLALGQIHRYPDSNAWAVNDRKVAGGGAMLAGDPHVPTTLPSFWFQVALSAPGLSVSGATTPGMPVVVFGHNDAIAWSITDTQNQSTLFYDEKTSPAHPHQYFWRGQWRPVRQLHYTIPVRGAATRSLTVDLTVHGPVMTTAGQTVSVDWMGAIPSPDLAVFLKLDQARDYAQFHSALASWRAPTENFVYADRQDDIGAISAGYFPVVRHGDPWLPLPGTGASDVAGVIPYAAVPQVYDPPDHLVASSNQRPVGNSYPYYIGTSANAFDPGYRAATVYTYLRGHSGLSLPSFAQLQANVTDGLAQQIVPRLLAALKRASAQPTSAQQQATQLLSHWNYAMTKDSAAASVWWTFWTDYLSAVFQPWWKARHVPVHLDRPGLTIGPYQWSLVEVLAAWTRSDQHNPAFTPPGGASRDANVVMRSAFDQAVAHLGASLGGSPGSWTWGRLHSREFPSLTGVQGLGYGPVPAGGDPWTVDGAYGGMTATVGPSWRMIARWSRAGAGSGQGAAKGKGSGSGSGSGSAQGSVEAEAIYPGGQSENPASAWYQNLIPDWWAGRYLAMPEPGSVAGPVRWELTP